MNEHDHHHLHLNIQVAPVDPCRPSSHLHTTSPVPPFSSLPSVQCLLSSYFLSYADPLPFATRRRCLSSHRGGFPRPPQELLMAHLQFNTLLPSSGSAGRVVQDLALKRRVCARASNMWNGAGRTSSVASCVAAVFVSCCCVRSVYFSCLFFRLKSIRLLL